jgi:hypothetical protein
VAIVYQDENGGFTCGSTGKPPVPMAWPARSMPSVPELLAAGVIERDLIEFMRQVRASNINVLAVFEKPEEVAAQLGVTLSEKTVNDLRALAPSKLPEIKDDVDRELIGFFHKVAEDGRYMDTWFTRPYEASQALGVELSDAALERLAAGGGAAFYDPSGGPVAQGAILIVGVAILAVIVAIIALSERSIDEMVKDRSGLPKI